MVVSWHGGSSKVSTSCIEPKGNTFSLENPRKWVLTSSSLALPMSILSKVEAKMMSIELPLSTRFRWTVLLATTARITKGSSWGAGIPPDLSQRMLWMCQAKAVWTQLVLPFPLLI